MFTNNSKANQVEEYNTLVWELWFTIATPGCVFRVVIDVKNTIHYLLYVGTCELLLLCKENSALAYSILCSDM